LTLIIIIINLGKDTTQSTLADNGLLPAPTCYTDLLPGIVMDFGH